jgi:hypothetical protein
MVKVATGKVDAADATVAADAAEPLPEAEIPQQSVV